MTTQQGDWSFAMMALEQHSLQLWWKQQPTRRHQVLRHVDAGYAHRTADCCVQCYTLLLRIIIYSSFFCERVRNAHLYHVVI